MEECLCFFRGRFLWQFFIEFSGAEEEVKMKIERLLIASAIICEIILIVAVWVMQRSPFWEPLVVEWHKIVSTPEWDAIVAFGVFLGWLYCFVLFGVFLLFCVRTEEIKMERCALCGRPLR